MMGGGNNKAVGSALAGYICVIAIWIVHTRTTVEIPPEVQSAIQGLIAFFAVYLIPHSSSSGQTN